nr:GGDEF domain-containing protein [Saccharopolyspora sp. HNM0983]
MRGAPLVVLVLPYVPLAGGCALLVLDATAGRVHAVEIYLLVAAVTLVVIRHLTALQQLYRAHRWLSHRALHDPLTGAANRTLLAELLEAAANEGPVAQPGLIYVDLNEFKTVNDRLGHQAGDALLRAVTDRLRQCVRGNDTVARVGGDEFVLLLDPAPARPDELLAQVSAAVEIPTAVPGAPDPVVVTASLGYHPIAPGQPYREALADADRAMYADKHRGL